MKTYTGTVALSLLTIATLSPLAQANSKKGHHHAPTHAKPTHHNVHHHNKFHHATPTHHHAGHNAKFHHQGNFVHTPKFATNVHVGNYGKLHGVKFSHGLFFQGHKHHHWTKRAWIAKYGTWGWFDPSTSGWFYWHATKAAYYPVSYITTAPPVIATQATAVVAPGGGELPLATGTEVPVIGD